MMKRSFKDMDSLELGVRLNFRELPVGVIWKYVLPLYTDNSYAYYDFLLYFHSSQIRHRLGMLK